jgi:hypothetical protein
MHRSRDKTVNSRYFRKRPEMSCDISNLSTTHPPPSPALTMGRIRAVYDCLVARAKNFCNFFLIIRAMNSSCTGFRRIVRRVKIARHRPLAARNLAHGLGSLFRMMRSRRLGLSGPNLRDKGGEHVGKFVVRHHRHVAG